MSPPSASRHRSAKETRERRPSSVRSSASSAPPRSSCARSSPR
jgi:hypothetical protein